MFETYATIKEAIKNSIGKVAAVDVEGTTYIFINGKPVIKFI